MDTDIHVNDIGTSLEVVMQDSEGNAVDLSGFTTLGICIQKPDSTILTKVAQFKTDGTDGIIYVLSEAGDLDIIGGYRIQAIVENPVGVWRSSIAKFKVRGNVCS